MNRKANKRKGSLDPALQAGWISLSELEVIRKLSMREHQSSLSALKDIGIFIIKASPHKFSCKDSLRRCHLHVLSHYWWSSTSRGWSQTNDLKAFWHSFENFTGKSALCPWEESRSRVGHRDVREWLCHVDLWCWAGSAEAAECLTAP